MTATHVIVTGLTVRIENVQHNLYVDNFFRLQHYLTIHILKKNCSGNVRAKINDMMKNFGQKMKLQLGDIKKVYGLIDSKCGKTKKM